MPTTFEGLRDAIATQLNTVTSIGVVQSRERWSDTWQDFLSLFKDTADSDIRGWTVAWENLKDMEEQYAAFGQRAYEYHFIVRGYLSFSDANNTEDTFNVLVESVRDVLNNQIDWSHGPDGAISGILRYGNTVDVAHHEKRMFGGVLCHYCELNVRVIYIEPITWQ